MTLQVDRHISGSSCVVWQNSEHYLDARRTYTGSTDIEIVRRGQVYHRELGRERDAPARIVTLMREKLT